MKNILKNKNGISLVSLSITVILIMIIVGVVLYNVSSNLGIQRLQSMQSDIENLRGKVSSYYLQYGALPILNTAISDSVLTDNVKTVENSNVDTGNYYVIDLATMENITLTYGEDYEKIIQTGSDISNLQDSNSEDLTDIYIINSVSHNIYYVAGIKYENTLYYKQYQDVEDNDIGLSGISFTEIEENSNYSPAYASTQRYEDKNGDVAIIPAGFQVSRNEDETTIENGLVVKDSNENEWVWIPVNKEDLSLLYDKDIVGWKMQGTGEGTGINEVITKFKTKSEIISGQTRTSPGSTLTPFYREPDMVIGNGSEYDALEENWSVAGFESYIDMITKLKNDYIDMINSINNNGGFYVGRFELSSEGTQKDKVSITNQNWYSLYAKCKTLGSNHVESRMIWGCQWDQICKFIENAKDANGDPISITDSSKYGNFKDSQYPADTGNYRSNFKRNTGSNEAWKINNIYDLAGNCWELTQEAYKTKYRAFRGGSYNFNSSQYSVTGRYYYDAASSYSNLSSRPALYIK